MRIDTKFYIFRCLYMLTGFEEKCSVVQERVPGRCSAVLHRRGFHVDHNAALEKKMKQQLRDYVIGQPHEWLSRQRMCQLQEKRPSRAVLPDLFLFISTLFGYKFGHKVTINFCCGFKMSKYTAIKFIAYLIYTTRDLYKLEAY